MSGRSVTRGERDALPGQAPRFADVVGELERVFARGGVEPLDDEAFNDVALRALDYQLRENPTYRAFCERRGVRRERLDRWEEAPPVPATAFKHLDLVSGDPARVDAIFRTSGTTRGSERRGRHFVPRLSLYRASLLPSFRAFVLPDGVRLPLLSLVPDPAGVPDSSLSTMIGAVAEDLCEEVRWLVDPSGVLDLEGFLDAASALATEGRAALVVGTAFALVHLLDAMRARGARVSLPEGTRVMETGGFKGRSRTVRRDALYAEIRERLGVPARRIVNEYGMTELLSQLYEPTLREERGERRHVPPPWLRVRALDPRTLAPLPEGRPGLLSFFDLANVGSVCHVLTEDLGSVAPDGVRLHGRTEGAEPRGCSRAMEELMAAAEDPR